MSFSITFFGPRHRWWDWTLSRRVWLYRPDANSTGAVGFCIPGLHVVLTWGKEKRKK